MSKAKVISIQAPRYRQCTLICDFLDFENWSIREEETLATNWIKDRPEGLKLQNLVLATITGRDIRSYPKNMTTDVQLALKKKMRLIGLRETMDPSRESISNCKGFSHRVCQFFDVIFQICSLSAV